MISIIKIISSTVRGSFKYSVPVLVIIIRMVMMTITRRLSSLSVPPPTKVNNCWWADHHLPQKPWECYYYLPMPPRDWFLFSSRGPPAQNVATFIFKLFVCQRVREWDPSCSFWKHLPSVLTASACCFFLQVIEILFSP